MTNEVIILAGQSNMVGSNTIPTPAPVYANDSRIWVKRQPWNAQNNVPFDFANYGSGDWVRSMPDPISGYPGAGVCPGKAMADRYITLRNDPNLNVGLVPCAVGATPIDFISGFETNWSRAMFSLSCWPHLISRALDAKNWGTIKCLVWYQGESDTGTFPHPQYMISQMELFERFRQRIGNPDLPIIYTQLGANPHDLDSNNNNYPQWVNMQNMQAWGSLCDPKIKMVTATDNSVMPDGLSVHKTAQAQITLGQQYADCLMTMQ